VDRDLSSPSLLYIPNLPSLNGLASSFVPFDILFIFYFLFFISIPSPELIQVYIYQIRNKLINEIFIKRSSRVFFFLFRWAGCLPRPALI
jgi:hypothetical protein